MSWESLRRGGLALAATLAVVLVLPSAAGAVLSGWNGRMLFVSGRGDADNNDSTAKIYLQEFFGDTAAGPAGTTVTPTNGIQHRHPTWSPDRTKIAYAAGDAATKNFDIYVLDLTMPGAVPQNITNSNNVTEDRPAWAPDGKHIAFESEVTDGSNQQDILVTEYPTGVAALFLTSTSAIFEGKPAWSPDSQTIYYVKGDLTIANATGIYKKAANGSGSEQAVLDDGSVSEFQPSISPDGTKMCFTRGSGVNATADIYTTTLANPTAVNNLSDDATNANYNCTWSPDGFTIAYVTGLFPAGDLVSENSNDDDVPGSFQVIEDTPMHFDGNPDWAPDGTPTCDPTTVETPKDTAVTIDLSCADVGPAYEQTNVREFIKTGPTHGKVGDVTDDPNPSPATTGTVTYTPNAGFSGTDTFVYYGFDKYQFATSATVTVKVDLKPPSIKNFKMKPRRWARGPKLPTFAVGSAKVKVGTTISFTLSKAAKVTFKFARKVAGKRKPAGKLTFNAAKGKNRVRFQGRLSKQRSLVGLGSYIVNAIARDSGGRTSKTTKTLKFKIVPR
jgi:Tol biopolymer transport system component